MFKYCLNNSCRQSFVNGFIHFFTGPAPPPFLYASAAIGVRCRGALPCGIHQLHTAAPVFDVGFKPVRRVVGLGRVVPHQTHVRFDREVPVVTALQKVGDDAGHVRIAISWKGVFDIGKEVVGIGNMAAVLECGRIRYLKLSRARGADHVVNPNRDDLNGRLYQCTGGKGVDVVIECTGRPEPIVGSFPLMAPRGRLVLLGSPRGVSTEVNFYPEIHSRGIAIVGAHADIRPARERSRDYWPWQQDCDLVLKLLAAGRLQVALMISEIFPWWQAAAAYDLLQAGALEQLGLLLDWTSDA